MKGSKMYPVFAMEYPGKQTHILGVIQHIKYPIRLLGYYVEFDILLC